MKYVRGSLPSTSQSKWLQAQRRKMILQEIDGLTFEIYRDNMGIS